VRASLAATRRTAISLTLAAAAAAAGVNETTLLRAIKAGKVSGNKDEHGQWHVEPAELHRIYPPVTQQATAVLEAEIAGLRQVGELLRGQVEATRQDRDRWAEAATAALRTLPEPLKSSRLWWRRGVA
jgi:predicted site-specific integrase-resolvase